MKLQGFSPKPDEPCACMEFLRGCFIQICRICILLQKNISLFLSEVPFTPTVGIRVHAQSLQL